MKKLLSLLVSIMTVFSLAIMPISAKEKVVIESENYEELDRYIEVVNNEYVLNLPDNVYLENDDLANVEKMLTESNNAIRENDLTINPNTKTAILSGVQTRAWGKNDIEFHWNFVRVYIDAGNLRIALTVGVGGLGGALAFLATSGWAAGAIGAATAALGIAANNVTDGIWFDYNYAFGVNNCGFQ